METTEIIRRYFDLVDAGDFDALDTVFHSQIVYHRPGYDAIVGIAALLDFYNNVRVLSGGGHTLDGIMVQGDVAVCWGRYQGRKKDGSPVDVQFADRYTFRDGLIIQRMTYFYQPSV